jgi:hypothetical protein
MVVLTHSDVRSYCLGIAQIVPVFLIALFVLEGTNYSKTTERLTRRSKRGKKAAVNELAKADKAAAKLIRDIVRADSILIGLDIADASLDRRNQRTVGIATTDLKAKKEASYREITQASSIIRGQLSRLPELRVQLETAVDRARLNFARTMFWYIIIGVAAELVTLWSAAGLLKGNLGIALSTELVIIVLGFLSYTAINRLTQQEKSRFYKFILGIWTVVTLSVGQATYFWIVTSVRVKG